MIIIIFFLIFRLPNKYNFNFTFLWQICLKRINQEKTYPFKCPTGFRSFFGVDNDDDDVLKVPTVEILGSGLIEKGQDVFELDLLISKTGKTVKFSGSGEEQVDK